MSTCESPGAQGRPCPLVGQVCSTRSLPSRVHRSPTKHPQELQVLPRVPSHLSTKEHDNHFSFASSSSRASLPSSKVNLFPLEKTKLTSLTLSYPIKDLLRWSNLAFQVVTWLQLMDFQVNEAWCPYIAFLTAEGHRISNALYFQSSSWALHVWTCLWCPSARLLIHTTTHVRPTVIPHLSSGRVPFTQPLPIPRIHCIHALAKAFLI